MDRSALSTRLRVDSEPHARGDGPRNDVADPLAGGRAPRTWGWTVHVGVWVLGVQPSPTHVGMDRLLNRSGFLGRPEPHARGDGPPQLLGARRVWRRAPRTWGWTDGACVGVVGAAPSPTHVGMDRRTGLDRGAPGRRPHAGRDGPAMFRAGSDGGSQAWGYQTWQHRGGTPMSCANAPPVWPWKPARTRPHETEQSPAPRTSSASTARPCATGWSRPRSMPETGPAPPPTRPNAWPSWSAKCTSCAGPTRS